MAGGPWRVRQRELDRGIGQSNGQPLRGVIEWNAQCRVQVVGLDRTCTAFQALPRTGWQRSMVDGRSVARAGAGVPRAFTSGGNVCTGHWITRRQGVWLTVVTG